MNKSALALLVPICLLPCLPAQSNENCGGTLIPDKTEINKDVHVTYSYLMQLDETTFNQKKRSGSLGADVILEGVPLSAYSSYESFAEARRRFARKHRIEWSYDDATSILIQKVSDNALRAYAVCKEAEARRIHGLHIWPTSIEEGDAVLSLYWNKPPGGAEEIPIRYSIKGLDGEGESALPGTLQDGQVYSALIERAPRVDQRVVANGGGYSSDILLKYVSPPPAVSTPLPDPLCQRKIDVPLIGLGHVAGIGDVTSSEWVGTKGQSRALEGFQLDFSADKFPNPVPDLGLEYMCHISGIGDSEWVPGGSFCGTRGQSRQLEGYAARLTGKNAKYFSLESRCHIQGSGDTGPFSNGEYCGTKGGSVRMEALRVSIVSNGTCEE